MHEGDEPNALADLRHADVLPGEDVAQIHLPSLEANPAALGDGEGPIVERVRELLHAAIDARRARVDVGRHFHAQGLMGPLLVEAGDEVVEARLLLQDIRGGWLRRFRLQRQMHAFVPPVLLRMARFDAFQLNAQAEPPHRELAQPVERMPRGER